MRDVRKLRFNCIKFSIFNYSHQLYVRYIPRACYFYNCKFKPSAHFHPFLWQSKILIPWKHIPPIIRSVWNIVQVLWQIPIPEGMVPGRERRGNGVLPEQSEEKTLRGSLDSQGTYRNIVGRKKRKREKSHPKICLLLFTLTCCQVSSGSHRICYPVLCPRLS